MEMQNTTTKEEIFDFMSSRTCQTLAKLIRMGYLVHSELLISSFCNKLYYQYSMGWHVVLSVLGLDIGLPGYSVNDVIYETDTILEIDYLFVCTDRKNVPFNSVKIVLVHF